METIFNRGTHGGGQKRRKGGRVVSTQNRSQEVGPLSGPHTTNSCKGENTVFLPALQVQDVKDRLELFR